MGIPIRILIVEDSEDDMLLMLREFTRNGYEPIYKRVETREDLEITLRTQPWDIIISDYTMPHFSGLMALEVVQKSRMDIPFIIISGNVGEDIAVAAMKAGAQDYLMKDNLTRLVPAVERELRENEVRWAHKRAEMAILHLTYHDALTGLINRSEFEQRVAQAMESAKTQNKQHALCFFDLDQFKVINDTSGHLSGDELLKQISITIQGAISETGILGRLGGDEFGLLLLNHDSQQAQQTIEKLRQLIAAFRFQWQGNSYEITASFGLVIIDSNSTTLAKALSSADIACFAAKEQGRNRLYIHDEDDVSLNKRHDEMQMVSRITKALKENRFRLYRQSIIPIHSSVDDVIHCEVLLRMIDEDGTVLTPQDFLSAAERYNLMTTIDRWVINAVFLSKQQASNSGYNYQSIQYSINLSGASMSDDTLLDYINAKAQEYQIDPTTICFEITETVAIQNLSKASQFIKECRKLGYRFALDDFGSGLSSFAYLKNLPIDYLKIDGSFVKGIDKDIIDYTMVEAINRIGQVMGIKTIAEFVENQQILEKLRIIGVDYAQGYGIDRPSPIDGPEAESHKLKINSRKPYHNRPVSAA